MFTLGPLGQGKELDRGKEAVRHAVCVGVCVCRWRCSRADVWKSVCVWVYTSVKGSRSLNSGSKGALRGYGGSILYLYVIMECITQTCK